MRETDLVVDKSQTKLGPIWLTEGVSRKNCLTLFFGCFFSIGIDQISPCAPFLLIGVANGALFLAALIIRIKSPGYVPAREQAFLQRFAIKFGTKA